MIRWQHTEQKQISNLTYKIVAHAATPLFQYNDCVDWAIEMLELGYDTPTLLIIAGMCKPVNPFEMPMYVDEVLNELGLEKKADEGAALSYDCYYVKRLLNSENIKYDLNTLCSRCWDMDGPDNIAELYNLNEHWNLLIDTSILVNDGALTIENIAEEVKKEAQNWLNKYQQQIDDTMWR